MARRVRQKKVERAIAVRRVARLVALADAAAREGRLDRAFRYADLAWRIRLRYQLRGTAAEGRVCRRCRAFLCAETARWRLRDGQRVLTCRACGAVRRKGLRRA